ncbi:ExbD/TolR family protein [Bartonella sp. DGB2]|uniref:ExbD/TolR family protein n=1 Tax=Bartonella sp. DGB2 TaxID=3388426 RepID=UPI0039903950
MAMTFMKRNKKRRRSSQHLMSEINVTPFVDVMLVLLIIFMVSAPLLINGVPLELPKTQAGPVQAEKTPLTISLDDKGKLAINQDYYPTPEAVVQKLTALLMAKPELAQTRLFLRAAKDIEYERVLALLALIQKAGFQNVALASLNPQKA